MILVSLKSAFFFLQKPKKQIFLNIFFFFYFFLFAFVSLETLLFFLDVFFFLKISKTFKINFKTQKICDYF